MTDQAREMVILISLANALLALSAPDMSKTLRIGLWIVTFIAINVITFWPGVIIR